MRISLLVWKACGFLVGALALFCLHSGAVHAQGGGKRVPVGEVIGRVATARSLVSRSEQRGAGAGTAFPIRLCRVQFDPVADEDGALTAGSSGGQLYPEGTIDYYIVQFDGPVRRSWKKAVTDTGAELFDYVPDFAFIARMDSSTEAKVRGLEHVRWLGKYSQAWRLSQEVVDRILGKEHLSGGQAGDGGLSGTREQTNTDPPRNLFRVTVFPGEDLARIGASVQEAGGMVLLSESTHWKGTLKVEIPREGIASLAAISGVKWVEPWPVWKLSNNKSTEIMNVNSVRQYPPAPAPGVQLYGSGQTVAVCDTGLDRGFKAPLLLLDDFENGDGGSRVLDIFVGTGATADDPDSGHGTHVAGSVLGNGDLSGSTPTSNTFPTTCFAGSAPQAELVFQAVGNNSDSLVGIPADLNTLFAQAQDAGAQLHTNSWGASQSGQYASTSEDVDEYVWGHRDFVIFFSAGNEGIDRDADGVIDLYSLGSPGTAKNCVTVGGSEGNRPSMTATFGGWWPFDFSASPIFSDPMADDAGGMVAFSSRGPCLDGRYKPDLVAPGTYILSTRSSKASGMGWGVYNDDYMYMGGTSMATPLAAGAGVLMREYLVDHVSIADPSAALIKASLLNSAEDISPGQYGTGSTQEIPDSPVPNNVEGWGRLNLANGVDPAAPFQIYRWDQSEAGLETGGQHTYTVDVTSADSALKVNLVWSDYPGSSVTGGGLVNDLDLLVIDPSAAELYPDGARQGATLTSLSYNTGNITYYWTSDFSVRFTPSSYPAYVDSTTLYLENTFQEVGDLDIEVYDDDGEGGLPGTLLYEAAFTHVPNWVNTFGIEGVVISEGSFYIAVRNHAQEDRGVLTDDTDPEGRSYYFDDDSSTWLPAETAAYIMANLRGTPYSTSFDRVNNAVGLTVTTPSVGTYTFRVTGYNVAQPLEDMGQPYALVVSGNIDNATAIALASFEAKPEGDHILLTWRTGTEIDTAGFNVQRSTSRGGNYETINASGLIAAKGGPETGADYAYADENVTPGITYYYRLEDIDCRGVSTLNGPVSAMVEARAGWSVSPQNATVAGVPRDGSLPANTVLVFLLPAAVLVWRKKRGGRLWYKKTRLTLRR